MSGLGDRRPLPLDGDREVVWCHACQRDWYNDEHEGSDCPHCHSDATEIIDPTDDPRMPILMDQMIQQGLGQPENQDETATAQPGFDHTQNTSNNRAGNSFFYSSTTTTTGPDGVRVTRSSNSDNPNLWNSNQGSPFSNINPVSSLLQQLMGMHGMPNHSDPHTPNQRSSPAPGTPLGSQPGQQSSSGVRMGFGYSSSGPSGTSSFSWGMPQRTEHDPEAGMRPRDASGASTGPQVQPMEELFSNILQMHAAPLAGQRGQGAQMPQNPLQHILASLFNPAHAAHGDAVFTQEAFDRVISQLMEQNSGSNAPPPASEDDINALPMKKVDKSMLGDNGEGECSVCMDNVELGEEVVSLPCNHWFHRPCVTMWLKEHNTCPICRKGISKEGENGSAGRPHPPQPPGAFPGSSSGGSPDGTGHTGGTGGPGAANDNNSSRAGATPGPFSFFSSRPFFAASPPPPPNSSSASPFYNHLGGSHSPSAHPISTVTVRRSGNGVSAIAIMSSTTTTIPSRQRNGGALRTEPYPHFLPIALEDAMPRTAPTRSRQRPRPQSQFLTGWNTPGSREATPSTIEPLNLEQPVWPSFQSSNVNTASHHHLNGGGVHTPTAESGQQQPDTQRRGITGRIRDFFTGPR